MSQLVNNVVACHRCEHRQRPCTGDCVCTLTGESFIAIAKRGDCPHPDGSRHAKDGLPPPAAAQEMSDDERELLAAAEEPQGWGDHVAATIHRMGADRAYKMVRRLVGLTGDCACNERRKALNRLEGWVKGVFSKRPPDERQQEPRTE